MGPMGRKKTTQTRNALKCGGWRGIISVSAYAIRYLNGEEKKEKEDVIRGKSCIFGKKLVYKGFLQVDLRVL